MTRDNKFEKAIIKIIERNSQANIHDNLEDFTLGQVTRIISEIKISRKYNRKIDPKKNKLKGID